jgi:putative cell wall-binding protein
MSRRHLRLLPAVLVATAITVGAATPATAKRGKTVATAAQNSSSGTLRVGVNTPMLPVPDPVYGRDAVGLAVNPDNSKHIVAIYSDYVTLWCEVAVSTDGGKKWRKTRLKAPGGFISPPCTVGNHLANFIDGGIAFGKDNRVYVVFASGILDAMGDSQGKSVLVARSNNGGRSFGVGQVILPGGVDADLGPDHTLPKLAIKRGDDDTDDRIFVSANNSVRTALSAPAQNTVVFTRSTDGGATWTPSIQASQPGVSSIEATQPAIGKDDALYLGWRTQKAAAQPGRYLPEGTIVVARSTDAGDTWTRTATAGVRGYVYAGPNTPLYASSRLFTASSFPRLAADPDSGNVYLVYNNGEVPLTQGNAAGSADHFIHNNADVYYQRSTDGGGTWSDPFRMNSDAKIQLEVTQTRHPNVSVADNGRVDIVWQDRRHWYLGQPRRVENLGTCTHTHVECDEARIGDTYWRSSSNGGAAFTKDRRITDHSINNDVGYDYRFGAYWDYGPKALPIGNDKILFAWMDSRDGNVETDSMGIYLAEANLKGSRSVPVRKLDRTSSADLSVKLSQRAFPGGGEAVLASTFASRPWSRVVIANERDFAGTLAGGVLARAFLGPVLLTGRDGLSDEVKAEVSRIAPVGAYVIGGEGTLRPQVISDLAAAGVPADQITRIAGPDAAGTAAQIATAMDRRTAGMKTANTRAFDAAVIVNQASPDAAAISVLAANRRFPVLLTNADAVPAATLNAIKALGITRTFVVGTSEFVSDAAMASLPKPTRLAGSDAVSTSRKILSESVRYGLPTNVVYASRASRRMDAAVMGAAVARIGALQLLTQGGSRDAVRIIGQKKMRTLVDHLIMVDRP